MKNIYFLIIAILVISMLTLPFIALKSDNAGNTDIAVPNPDKKSETVCVKTADGIISVPTSDYIEGVVAAEISPDSEPEALKAQAVAAYTYLLYKKDKNKREDYDIICDAGIDQAYIDTAAQKEKWGDAYDANIGKIREACNAVAGIYVSFENKPIYAAFHAVSAGKTENCSDVFGGEYPYLVSVQSIGDLLCPDYLSTVTLSADEVRSALGGMCSLPENPEEFFTAIERSDAGGIKTLTVGGKTFTGQEIRSALSLRSANFDIAFDGTAFTFTVRGYGHGVGMSQYGANYMAQQGSLYNEILLWYYTGCSLKTSK